MLPLPSRVQQVRLHRDAGGAGGGGEGRGSQPYRASQAHQPCGHQPTQVSWFYSYLLKSKMLDTYFKPPCL